MDRRRFVTGFGTSALPLLAGCIATDGREPEPTDANASPTGSPQSTPDASTPTMDAPFPPDRDDVDEVVWYRQVSNPDSALVLEPSATTASLPDAELSFTLHNDTGRQFQINFYNWAVFRWEDGRWHRVAPTMVPEPLHTLPAGESHRWTLSVDNSDLSATSFHTSGTDDLSVAALGGGNYAFAVEGWWPDQDATPTYEHKTMRAARFMLDGDPLPLEPSTAVTDVEREDGTATVSARNESAAETGEDREATFVLTRDDSVTDPRHLVTEQVYREWPLRDALAHVGPGIDEVRVETTTTGVPAFGVLERQSPIAYEGQTYRLSAEDSRE